MSKHQLAGSLSKKTLTLEGKIKLLDSEATTGGIYKISQNSQENTRAISFLINKVADGASNFIKKETLAQVFSCEFWKIFKNTFFTEHFWTSASFDSNKKKKTKL